MKKTTMSNQPMQLSTPVDVLLGRAAMMGFVFLFGAYLTADAIAPGFF